MLNKIKSDFKVMKSFLNKKIVFVWFIDANVMYLIVNSSVLLNQLLVRRSPAGCSQAREGGNAATRVKLLHSWIKMTITNFVNKIMHNFKIRFYFFFIFSNQTYILAVFNDKASKVFFLNKSIFTFLDTELDMQRFYQKGIIII